jgi:hypothetical protein
MKKQHLFPLLAVVVLLAAGSVHAQSPVKANIPFDFTAGSRSLPAGEYTITAMGDAGTLLLIAGSGSSKAFVIPHGVETLAAPTSSKLVFNRYGNRYFLSQIWVQGERRGCELPRTRFEQEMASNARPDSVAILAQK